MGFEAADAAASPFSEEVAAGVRAGDPDAIGEVYVRLADRLLSFLMARVRDRATAEDILEATFIELLQKGHTIRGGPSAIKVWLFRAAQFNTLDHIRKTKRRREDLHADLAAVEVVDHHRGPAELAIADDLRDHVKHAMEQLTDEQREVLLLRYVAQLSGEEVAEVMGRSPGAVRSLQHRGERTLARVLDSLAQPAPKRPLRTSEEQE